MKRRTPESLAPWKDSYVFGTTVGILLSTLFAKNAGALALDTFGIVAGTGVGKAISGIGDLLGPAIIAFGITSAFAMALFTLIAVGEAIKWIGNLSRR